MPIYRNKTDHPTSGFTLTGKQISFAPHQEKYIPYSLMPNVDLEIVSEDPDTPPILSTTLTVPAGGTQEFDILQFVSNYGDNIFIKNLYFFHRTSDVTLFFSYNNDTTILHRLPPDVSIELEENDLDVIYRITFSNTSSQNVVVYLFMSRKWD